MWDVSLSVSVYVWLRGERDGHEIFQWGIRQEWYSGEWYLWSLNQALTGHTLPPCTACIKNIEFLPPNFMPPSDKKIVHFSFAWLAAWEISLGRGYGLNHLQTYFLYKRYQTSCDECITRDRQISCDAPPPCPCRWKNRACLGLRWTDRLFPSTPSSSSSLSQWWPAHSITRGTTLENYYGFVWNLIFSIDSSTKHSRIKVHYLYVSVHDTRITNEWQFYKLFASDGRFNRKKTENSLEFVIISPVLSIQSFLVDRFDCSELNENRRTFSPWEKCKPVIMDIVLSTGNRTSCHWKKALVPLVLVFLLYAYEFTLCGDGCFKFTLTTGYYRYAD